MSVATIQPPASLYREEQFFAWWVYAILGSIVGLAWFWIVWPNHAGGGAAARPLTQPPLSLLVGLALPPALVVGFLRMTTEVALGQCRVWFGFVPTYRRAIPLEFVTRVEIVNYRAFRDHVFWGVRTLRDGERIMTARGSRAVRLHLSDGSRVLIGSQKPEELAESLERARRPFASL